MVFVNTYVGWEYSRRRVDFGASDETPDSLFRHAAVFLKDEKFINDSIKARKTIRALLNEANAIKWYQASNVRSIRTV